MKKTLSLCFAILLSGCTNSMVSEISSASHSSVQKPFSIQSSDTQFKGELSKESLTDFDNLTSAFCNFNSIVPTGKGDSFFRLGTAIQYCDPSVSDRFTYYCFENGCKHTDTTCHAYIGNAEQFIAWEGVWYYSRINRDGEYELVRHNPDTNEREVLVTYEKKDDGSLWEYISSFFVSHNVLYIQVTQNITDPDSLEQSVSGYIDTIDISTLSQRKLSDCNDKDSFFGGNGKKAVICHVEYHQTVNGQMNPYTELRIMDLASGESELIADTDHGFSSYFDLFQLVHHNELVYLRSDEIHILNLESMEDRTIYHSDRKISCAWFFGNRIRFLEKTESESDLSEKMISLDGTELCDFPKMVYTYDSGEQVTRLAPRYLTEHGQIGFIQDDSGTNRYGWISEKDYLNCDLDKAVYYNR